MKNIGILFEFLGNNICISEIKIDFSHNSDIKILCEFLKNIKILNKINIDLR